MRNLCEPAIWISLYILGYITVVVVLSSKNRLGRVQKSVPKPVIIVFILLTFIAPPVILPFARGPGMGIPSPISITLGIILVALNFIIKFLSQWKIGTIPSFKNKGNLVTAGIYGIIRHPLYISNGLLAMGLAILFDSMHAFLFSVCYSLLFLPIIYYEERDLVQKYGEEYLEYKRKVPWRIIPWVI